MRRRMVLALLTARPIKKRRVKIAGVLTAALVSAFLIASPAHAKNAVLVGSGTVASCNEGALRNALLNPPVTVGFFCGGPASITINMPIAITGDTDVDGGKDQIDLVGLNTGPIFQVDPSVTLSLSTLNIKSGNAGLGDGGAVVNNGKLVLEQVGLISNQAARGGAIYNAGELVVHDSTFQGNSGQRGGAVYNAPGATARFVNSTLSGNGNSVTIGGGLYNDDGTVDFNSVTIYLNSAGNAGAAIYNAVAGAPISARNTIVAGTGGGVAQCSEPITSNGHNLSSDGSCGFNQVSDLSNTIPQLNAIANNGGFTLTHMPKLNNPTSPAIDKGDTQNCQAFDQPDNKRPFGKDCDIGSVEQQSAPHVWYVSASSGDDVNYICSSMQFPCATINGAIAKAQSGDAIYVTAETYKSADPVQVVDVNKDLTISGGWDGGFTAQTYMTTIDGEGSRRDLTVEAGSSATMDRFIVQNGNSTLGAGAHILGTLVGREMAFRDNSAGLLGGGALYVSAYPAYLDLRNSGVYYNHADTGGGGLFVNGGTAWIESCTISNNFGKCFEPEKCIGITAVQERRV